MTIIAQPHVVVLDMQRSWIEGLTIACPSCAAPVAQFCDVAKDRRATRPRGSTEDRWLHHVRHSALPPVPGMLATTVPWLGPVEELPPAPNTMRVRVVVEAWHEVLTDTARVIRAMQWLQQRFGTLPVFVGGVDPGLEDDGGHCGWEPGAPPEDTGLGVILTIPVWPEMAAYLALKRQDIEEPAEFASCTHKAVDTAQRRVAASKTLGLAADPADLALVALAERRAHWRRATYDNRPQRLRTYEEDLRTYIRETVDPMLGGYMGECPRGLLSAGAAFPERTTHDATLLALGVVGFDDDQGER